MFDQQDFRSANMLLGITDEALCIKSLRRIQANGLDTTAQHILDLPHNATIAQVIARVEAYAEQVKDGMDREDAMESIAWLKAAAAKL